MVVAQEHRIDPRDRPLVLLDRSSATCGALDVASHRLVASHLF
jgi:hypothetical protein